MTIYQWIGVALITAFLVVSCAESSEGRGCHTDTECGCVLECL